MAVEITGSASGLDRDALLEKSGALLGWPELLEALAGHALSGRARESCRNMPLALSRAQAEELLDGTSEMVELLIQGKPLPLAEFEDVSNSVERARAEGTLEVEALEQIAKVLEISNQVKTFFKDKKISASGSNFPRLSQEARLLDPVRPLKASLDKCLDNKGGLKDTASPDLKRLRTRHRRLRDRIHKRLEAMLSQEDIATHLQDQFYTQRNQRYVIPVRAEARPRFEGIVHDSSASGATVFLEPSELIEPNNELKILELEILSEEQRILKDLSRQVAEGAEAIIMDQQVLTRLDVLQAKARLAAQLNASRPLLSDSNAERENARIKILSARHPLLLLRRENVVPNDLELGPDKNVLVISGPNAGGKTVCLKMMGLFSLMVRAGLFIPASPDSRIPIFPEVFADIGDEQDIGRDISTYSGHLLNIIGILRHAGKMEGSSVSRARAGSGSVKPGALVLLDEIASSTDPGEASALAAAILKELRDKAALTIATTHLGSLKMLAEKEAGFENAGLEFDPDTLTPTYRLRIGVPGLSLGIHTAAVLGLPENLVSHARELMDTDTVKVDELIRRLEIERKNMEDDRADVQAELGRLKELTEEYRKRMERLKERERNFKKDMKARLREELERARGELAAIIQSLKLDRTVRKVQESKKEIEAMKEKMEDEYPEDIPEGQIPGLDQLRKGVEVQVVPFGKTAVLLEDAREDVQENVQVRVNMAGIKLTVDASDLRVVPGEDRQEKASRDEAKVHYISSDIEPSPTPHSPENTLDLRGMRAHEAEAAVETYLDDACRKGLPNVFIIHGHGTGVLKQMVREYLATSSYAQSFRPGEKKEGGDGVTMVILNLMG